MQVTAATGTYVDSKQDKKDLSNFLSYKVIYSDQLNQVDKFTWHWQTNKIRSHKRQPLYSKVSASQALVKKVSSQGGVNLTIRHTHRQLKIKARDNCVGNRSIATETEILEDTLGSGVDVEGKIFGGSSNDTSGIYASLEASFPPASVSQKVISCLRQFIIIIISVSVILLLTIVIPLKLGFSWR